jgi:hypothetical protein
MGYGSRAIELLQQYYEGKMVDIGEGNKELQSEDIESVHDEGLSLVSERLCMNLIYQHCVQILMTFMIGN